MIVRKQERKEGNMKRVYDYSVLRGDIRKIFKTEQEFAKKMGFKAQNSLSDRFSGKVEWRQEEMVKACMLLDKPFDCIDEYFFTF